MPHGEGFGSPLFLSSFCASAVVLDLEAIKKNVLDLLDKKGTYIVLLSFGAKHVFIRA
jgi:hypothetical protein